MRGYDGGGKRSSLGRDEPMAPHYATATAPSALLVEKILEESDRIVGECIMVKKELDP